MSSLGVVAAYQTGVIRRLPDPPGRLFDSDRVDASGEAYRFLGMPDSLLGIASYAATVGLTAMGAADRHQRHPAIPILAAAKILADVGTAGYLTLEQATKHRKFCAWCVTASVAAAAMVPFALPEARAAWRHLRAR